MSMPRLGRSTPQPSAQSSVGFRWPIDCGSNLARGMLARHKGCARQRSCFRLPLALSITRNTGFFPLATDGTGVGRRCGREKPSGIDIASDPNPSFEYVQPAREVTKTERQKLSNDMSARSGRVRGTTPCPRRSADSGKDPRNLPKTRRLSPFLIAVVRHQS